MQGIGNDFVVLDAVAAPPPKEEPEDLARRMCDRRFGIGADGLIFVERGSEAPFRMRMYNPDGSESEMCGNGIRCVGRLLSDSGYADSAAIPVETGAGTLVVEPLANGSVRVDMGPARLTRGEIGIVGDPSEGYVGVPIRLVGEGLCGTAVSMGNPHLVIPVPCADVVPLAEWGPRLEVHPDFPNRTNVHFVEALSRSRLRQRTWERGAGATLACGTGACAAVVAMNLLGLSERNAMVDLPGGSLEIEYLANGHVLMSGSAEYVFDGKWPSA
jgi:diaminopimelate epimerase